MLEKEKKVSEEKPEMEETETKESSEETQQQEVPDLNAELEKAKKDYLYLYADFENYRKKAIQERSQIMKYANENLLRDMIQVMDNFQLAISMEVNSENIKSFVDGVNMISKELKNTIEKYGVSPINAETDFDPNLHEALGTEETDEVESGKIFKVFKHGYKLHDRLLRPAQVIIATEKKES